MRRTSIGLAFTVLLLFIVGCGRFPGQPLPHAKVIAPDQISDFNTLFEGNCAGCHGFGGTGGAAIPLRSPVFLSIADDTVIRQTATHGVPGTPMPAFAQSAGGMLTDKQIDAIVNGIRSWADPGSLGGEAPPPYAATTPGDPHRGAEVYAKFCSRCHGPDGRGGSAGSIVNGSYLALISNQNLRTVVIIGRPELGFPDWRSNIPGRPMSSSEVSDVVSWLAAQRPQFPGRPFPNPAQGSATRLIP